MWALLWFIYQGWQRGWVALVIDASLVFFLLPLQVLPDILGMMALIDVDVSEEG